jgi:beta-glucosidase
MPWLGSVSAVLEAWFPGQRGAEAIANILFGVVNPSGKLPITFPASVADLPNPTIAGTPNASVVFPVSYSEGYLVGYKWYDSKGMTPLFPFGFGLSYTTFSIKSAGVVVSIAPTSRNVVVLTSVANTSAVAGAEVVQVYLGLPANTGEPPKRLVGWTKVFLQPGASASVSMVVNEGDSSHPMSYWDTNSNSWRTAPGDYLVYVGNSSAQADLTLAGTFHVGS